MFTIPPGQLSGHDERPPRGIFPEVGSPASVNGGISGDRQQNVSWRLEHGGLDREFAALEPHWLHTEDGSDCVVLFQAARLG